MISRYFGFQCLQYADTNSRISKAALYVVLSV